MKKGVFVIAIVICAIVFGVSAYNLISYYSDNRAAEKGFAELLPEEIAGADVVVEGDEKSEYDYMLPHYQSLREDNSDMVGWLRIPGTRISYPVMQTKDSPEFYLRRDFNKEFSMNGCLFVDSKGDVDLPTDVVLVYGHRMRSNAMFGTLGDFLDPEFLDQTYTIIFDTFTERNVYYIYCLFSLDVSVAGSFDYYNYTQFHDRGVYDDFMNGVNAHKEIEKPENTPEYGDKILLLSTCEYTHADGRLIIVAVKQ